MLLGKHGGSPEAKSPEKLTVRKLTFKGSAGFEAELTQGAANVLAGKHSMPRLCPPRAPPVPPACRARAPLCSCSSSLGLACLPYGKQNPVMVKIHRKHPVWGSWGARAPSEGLPFRVNPQRLCRGGVHKRRGPRGGGHGQGHMWWGTGAGVHMQGEHGRAHTDGARTQGLMI